MSLAPLDRHQVREMVGDLAARRALPKEVVESVTERTGGVPLFVEEVTRLLLEHGAESVHTIPPTLQQSLTTSLPEAAVSSREAVAARTVIRR
jgi:predicted ATPase